MLKRVVTEDLSETTTRFGKKNYAVKNGVIYMLEPYRDGIEFTSRYRLNPVMYKEQAELLSGEIMYRDNILREMDRVYTIQSKEDLIELINKEIAWC